MMNDKAQLDQLGRSTLLDRFDAEAMAIARENTDIMIAEVERLKLENKNLRNENEFLSKSIGFLIAATELE